MSNQKKTHYNIDEIASKGCLYNLIYGSRSDGKSYQVKHKMAVVKYVKTHRRFILLRRWSEEIKTDKIEQYFNDVDVTDSARVASFMVAGYYVDEFLPVSVSASATDLASRGLHAVKYDQTKVAYGEVNA